MNARRQLFEFDVQGRQADETISSIFHTVLFHRSTGKFKYSDENQYSINTIGYTDVDCDFIDLTYLRVSSKELACRVKDGVSKFSESLGKSQTASGQITLSFYQQKSDFFRKSICVPWEIWAVRVQLITPGNESERLLHRERLSEMLTEKIWLIAEEVNRNHYLPTSPSRSELEQVFDTSFSDVQPYLFKLSHSIDGPSNISVGSQIRNLIRDSLNL